jgi:hypothetical protein
MADITLAECDGNTWVVGGEQYIDDLLANTLPPDVTIELIACDSKSDVMALWMQNCGPLPDGVYGDPWVIHPAIAQRIRRASPDHAVFFAQWSAMLDADALAVIHAAALRAAEHPEAPVVLAQYLDQQGVDRARMQRITRPVAGVPGMGQESQRIEVVVRVE